VLPVTPPGQEEALKGFAPANLPKAVITFHKMWVAHERQAVDKTRRIEQKTDPALKDLSCHRISMRFAAVHESGFGPTLPTLCCGYWPPMKAAATAPRLVRAFFASPHWASLGRRGGHFFKK
jgi:hypothetical protein